MCRHKRVRRWMASIRMSLPDKVIVAITSDGLEAGHLGNYLRRRMVGDPAAQLGRQDGNSNRDFLVPLKSSRMREQWPCRIAIARRIALILPFPPERGMEFGLRGSTILSECYVCFMLSSFYLVP